MSKIKVGDIQVGTMFPDVQKILVGPAGVPGDLGIDGHVAVMSIAATYAPGSKKDFLNYLDDVGIVHEDYKDRQMVVVATETVINGPVQDMKSYIAVFYWGNISAGISLHGTVNFVASDSPFPSNQLPCVAMQFHSTTDLMKILTHLVPAGK
jgi:hypothetical protein